MIEKIFLIHHTHVDLGFTDNRDKVADDLVDMVDEVTDLVDSSASRPMAERFRWTHEVSWPVLEYLRRGDKKGGELFRQIRNGDVELTALYVNPTDLFDRYTLEHSIDYACNLAREHSLPLVSAMFCDCPGIPWSVVDILAQRGIRYLSAAPDFVMSNPLDVERPFYWQGPDGGKVLVWFSDWRNFWYAEGLFLLKPQDVKPDEAVRNLLKYAEELEREDYRWKGLAIHVAMDNEPPLPQLMDTVKHFNGQQSERELRLATNREFFEYIEAQHKEAFFTHRGAWPDWWANGNASAAYEVACSRRAKLLLKRGILLAEQIGAEINPALLERVVEDILMFDEHTWGSSGSADEPWSLSSRLQWTQKRVHALRAHKGTVQIENQILGELDNDNIVAANSLGIENTNIVCVPLLEPDSGTPVLTNVSTGEQSVGQRAKADKTAGKEGEYYAINLGPKSISHFTRSALPIAAPVDGADALESRFYRFGYDNTTGAILSVWVKDHDRELFDANSPWSFGEIIHERIKGGDRDSLYSDEFGENKPESKRPRPEFIRKAGHVSKCKVRLVRGGVFDSLLTSGSLPGLRFVREIRLYHSLRRLDVLLQLDKQVVTSYESIYLAFPFGVHSPEVWIENAGAAFRAGIDQLPGSATDWHSVGDYVAISNHDYTVTLLPHDSPVVQVADINVGKWAKTLELTSAHIYSWVMNNMWFTNFPAYQEGRVNLSWTLTTQGGTFDKTAAERFAQSTNIGFSCKVGGDKKSIVW